MTDAAWSQPHHDGSATYVPDPSPSLGGRVSVFLRVPRTSDVTSAWVRVINDGEPELVHATVDRQDQRDTWLRADLPVINPVVSYRWLLDGGPHGYQWLNGAGLHGRDVADTFDFRLSTYAPPPRWATGTMVNSSSPSPEYDRASSTSSRVIMPRSPCAASAACTNIDGVPVEASVAAILRPMWPLLPMPVTIEYYSATGYRCSPSFPDRT